MPDGLRGPLVYPIPPKPRPPIPEMPPSIFNPVISLNYFTPDLSNLKLIDKNKNKNIS